MVLRFAETFMQMVRSERDVAGVLSAEYEAEVMLEPWPDQGAWEANLPGALRRHWNTVIPRLTSDHSNEFFG